jgi:hypothetical protein
MITEDRVMGRLIVVILPLCLGAWYSAARADDPSVPASASGPPATTSAEEAPLVSLGRPQAFVQSMAIQSTGAAASDQQIARTSFQSPEPLTPIVSTTAQSAPPPGPVLPAQASVPVSPVAPATPAEQYNCGVVTQQSPGFWQSIWEGPKRIFNYIPGLGGEEFEGPGARHWFQSDHCFDNFISPVTNPFLFEDPRSLTEIRPIFIYNATPTRNPIFHGGDIEFFGTQARVAFTDRWSLVVNKFGEIWSEPHNGTPDFQPHAGFSEVWLGPKFTFLRNENTCTLGAVGLTFEIPGGEQKVMQDTGSLSLDPYLSMGQSFGKTQYGSFNALGTIGYRFSVDRKRSEDFFTSLHLDFDIANLHRFYPLVELNWFHYTRNGETENINFEGRDLFNFGSQHVAGHDEVSLALGGRVKATEWWWFGFAFEFPLTTRRDLMDYRVTVDMIFRY